MSVHHTGYWTRGLDPTKKEKISSNPPSINYTHPHKSPKTTIASNPSLK